MAKKKRAAANRKYKDTVFRMLFSDKEHLLELYNAINGTAYTNPEELKIVTLKNAVYMGMKNDLAFIIDTNLFLYEHQSTYNPNMPLRDLFYIASEYQKLVDKRSLYSSTLQKIPAPKFLVFYNGTKEMEDSRTEYLSAAFENLTGEPDLELKVLTLNINEGHNGELMEQCRVLKEYAQYVSRVRKYVRKMGLEYGADDYITKPFNILEVKARIKAIMRRTGKTAAAETKSKTIEVGDLMLDCEGRRVSIAGKEINLTAKEFDVLELLVFNPNKVYSRENLLDIVWGYEYPGDVRTVDVHIRRLREKIEANPRSFPAAIFCLPRSHSSYRCRYHHIGSSGESYPAPPDLLPSFPLRFALSSSSANNMAALR